MLQNSILQHLLFFCPYFLLRKIVPKKSPIYFFALTLFSAKGDRSFISLFEINLHAYARDARTVQGFYVFCCHKCHTSPSNHLYSTQLHPFLLFPLVPRKEFADFIPKTTRRFVKNNTSFYEKQHVVLWETTRRFVRNNTSFLHKIFGKNNTKNG